MKLLCIGIRDCRLTAKRDMDGTSDNPYPAIKQINNSLDRKPLMRTLKDCDRDIEV